MRLLEQAFYVWNDLKGKGWRGLLQRAGLNLDGVTTPDELRDALLAPCDIRREVPGFEDFASEGTRGIEPGKPARSLLYHALASPRVLLPYGTDDSYPTPEQLEVIENLVFGIVPPSVAELRQRAGGAPLAIVVFTSEYRPAAETPHKNHAEMCYSRTGIARVGNKPPRYLPESRGYLTFFDDQRAWADLAVLPCRFAAYVAARMQYSPCSFGPVPKQDCDEARLFWVPLHKLFSGGDCLQDCEELDVQLQAFHVNDKIRRVHLALRSEGFDTGQPAAVLDKPPFICESGLADFHQGLLTPLPHPVVEEARQLWGLITLRTPARKPHMASLQIQPRVFRGRWAPEFVYVKRELTAEGKVRHLSERPERVEDSVAAGGYDAVQYVDYAADGWVEARCEALAAEVPQHVSAYSVIAPPVFFPLVTQEEVITWWKNSAPPELASLIWSPTAGPPAPLSYNRFPANIARAAACFDPKDQTITAIVTQPGCAGEAQTRVLRAEVRRVSPLPDRASNTFAPGWDTAVDFNSPVPRADAVKHLAAYGLASPFADDAMICAAESAFWPAATPDIARSLPPDTDPITTPLPDRLLGWDGLPRPVRTGNVVEYIAPDYADYVQAILDRKMLFGAIACTRPQEFNEWTLIMARVFQAFGVKEAKERARWGLLHFLETNAAAATMETGTKLGAGHTYRLDVFRAVPLPGNPIPFNRKRVGVEMPRVVYADPNTVVWRDEGSTRWNPVEF